MITNLTKESALNCSRPHIVGTKALLFILSYTDDEAT